MRVWVCVCEVYISLQCTKFDSWEECVRLSVFELNAFLLYIVSLSFCLLLIYLLWCLNLCCSNLPHSRRTCATPCCNGHLAFWMFFWQLARPVCTWLVKKNTPRTPHGHITRTCIDPTEHNPSLLKYIDRHDNSCMARQIFLIKLHSRRIYSCMSNRPRTGMIYAQFSTCCMCSLKRKRQCQEAASLKMPSITHTAAAMTSSLL